MSKGFREHPLRRLWTSLAAGSLFPQDANGKETELLIGDEDQVLTVVGGLPAWADATGGGGGASSVAELTDVDLTGLDDKYLLVYDEGTSLWKVRLLTSSDLPDAGVTDAKLADMPACSVKTRAANSTGVPGNTAASANDKFLVRRSNALTFDTLLVSDIPTRDFSLNLPISGGGSVIAAGYKLLVMFDFPCTILENVVLGQPAVGAIVIDIEKTTYSGYAGSGSSICASARPTIAASNWKSRDTTLTGWTTSVATDDVWLINVISCSVFTDVTLKLKLRRT